ncbi:MAG: phosphatidylethanolamine N-methyltransferase [Gammaproteobacteria bacterium SG8_11]|nr:MAG: phosphatidylethanolamine N-methyltransferase [Gammaproteobacteria bacterium SG8_11]
MGLKHSYTLFAPFYDAIVGGVFDSLRKSSLDELRRLPLNDSKVLLSGIGTGLDVPFLPTGPEYIGIDLTPAMINKAQGRGAHLNIKFHTGNAMQLPFEDNQFDAVVMHLILAVVPNPVLALQETQRVLKTGGYVLVLDKFLRPGEAAPLRRLINPIIKQLATQTNVVFEDVLSHCKALSVINDVPVAAGGWFRRIVLQKNNYPA